MLFGVLVSCCSQSLATDSPTGSPSAAASATVTPKSCNVHELLENLEPQESEEFPLPEELEPAYHFWRRVYGEWTYDEAILHKNVSYEFKKDDDGDIAVYDGDSDYVIDYSNRAAAVVARRAGHGEYWRMQRGQRDRLEGAFQTWLSNRPRFDDTFESHDAPIDASALGFIESMFDNTATSSTGAQGVFQIQPWEGHKLGARVDASYNDLRDPGRSAALAARKLAQDAEILRDYAKEARVKDVPTTWPLALLSYNQGVGSMKRAVSNLKTVAIEEVIARHGGGQWGFAGKNFYPQFRVFYDLVHEARDLGCTPDQPRIESTAVTLDAYITLSDLAACCGVERDTLIALNPGFTEMALDDTVRLSKGLDVYVPTALVTTFKAKLHSDAAKKKKHDEQVPFARYRLSHGENLTGVALKTGTPLFSILRENNLTIQQANRVHAGTMVGIPNPQFAELARRAAALPDDRPVPKGFRLHRVRSGQTVRSIERAYGLKAGELEKWNDLETTLEAGIQLAIPYYS